MLIELLEYSLPAMSVGLYFERVIKNIRNLSSKGLPPNVFRYRIKEKNPPYAQSFKYIDCPACDHRNDPNIMGQYCECLENTADPHIHGECRKCRYQFAMLTKLYNK